MAWLWRDGGSTSAIGLGVATALFATAFVAANVMVAKPGGIAHDGVVLDMRASTALDVIVAQGGSRSNGGAWLDAPDELGRFGLAADGQPNFLDYRKIRSMRNASMEASVNSAPDYADVKAALGLSSTDFHLRTYPVLPGMDDPRWSKDPHGRFAYVAHDLSTSTPTGSATVTTTTSTVGNALNVSVAIRNDGATPYLFSATIGLGEISTSSILVDEERHTRQLASGETQTVWVEFPRMAYTGSPDGVRVTVADAAGRVISGPTWTAATLASSGTTHTVGVKVSAGARYYVSGETVSVHVNRYDGTGAIPNSQVDWRVVVVGTSGSEIHNATIMIKKKKSATYDCTTCTTAGVYTFYFYNADMSLRARDMVQVLAETPSSGPPIFGGTADKEIELIGRLVENFNPTVYSATTNPEGDVFDDANKVRKLPPLLQARYTTLIVGSEVAQNALNSADIKWAIADWVIEGGNLMVLGRLDTHSNWLEPVYKASIAGASGGIGAPDPTHPILTTPNRLTYQRYNDNGVAWGVDEDQPFTHVLTRGVSNSESQDALAVSNPGAFNNGSVVLTSYMPGAITTPQDDAEALRLLQNMMSQSYNMLFLDFGPPLPDHVSIGSAQRLVAVPHPNVPGAVVETRIVMYAWN